MFRRLSPLIIFVLACTVRVISVLEWHNPEEIKHLDYSEYVALAQNLRFHGTLSFGAPHHWGEDGLLNAPGPFLPSAARAPLYPLVIASLWWHSTPPIAEVLGLQVLLAALVALFVYWMALDCFGPRHALLAGLLMALAPLSVRSVAWVLTETIFTFLLTVGIWLWGAKRGFLSGIVLGFATLTRAVLFPFVLMLLALTLVCKFDRGLHRRIAFGALLVIAPWTIRNAVTQHAFIPINVQGWGSNLLFGTIDGPYGSGNPWPLYVLNPVCQEIIQSSPSESDAERRMTRAAVKRILASPLRWAWIRTKQYEHLFADSGASFYFLPISPRLIKFAFLLGNFVFLLLSTVGVYLTRRRWRGLSHLLFFPVFFAAAQFPMLTFPRYSLPLVPMMAIFAAPAILLVYEKCCQVVAFGDGRGPI